MSGFPLLTIEDGDSKIVVTGHAFGIVDLEVTDHLEEDATVSVGLHKEQAKQLRDALTKFLGE